MRKYTLADVQGRIAVGQVYHDLYATYYAIMRRCYNKSYRQYHDYGGRGIAISDEWRGNPYEFMLWVLNNLGPRPENCTLDREDNDGNYTPNNLRWATKVTQQLNRRPPQLIGRYSVNA